MREIVFDTETTGLHPLRGDRLVEIACVELVDKVPTGNILQHYVNPEREIPDIAFRLHGLSNEFLADKPLFRDVADDVLSFMGESRLVAHHAEFDANFLNMELIKCARIPIVHNRLIDTHAIAKRRYPGISHTLDDLCAKFGVDVSLREKHGALVDAKILAALYRLMCGAPAPQPSAPEPVAVEGIQEEHAVLKMAPRRSSFGLERI